ncbi:hypothetical protein FRB97_004832, partial [Tulasnella sp. 331]
EKTFREALPRANGTIGSSSPTASAPIFPEATPALEVLNELIGTHGGPVFGRVHLLELRVYGKCHIVLPGTLGPVLNNVELVYTPLNSRDYGSGTLQPLVHQLASFAHVRSLTLSSTNSRVALRVNLDILQELRVLSLYNFVMLGFGNLGGCSHLIHLTLVNPAWTTTYRRNIVQMTREPATFPTLEVLQFEDGTTNQFPFKMLRSVRVPQLRRLSLQAEIFLRGSDTKVLRLLGERSALLETLVINLGCSAIPITCLRALSAFKSLHHLNLQAKVTSSAHSPLDINDEGMEVLAKALPDLRSLSVTILSHQKGFVTEKSVSVLGENCGKLEELEILLNLFEFCSSGDSSAAPILSLKSLMVHPLHVYGVDIPTLAIFLGASFPSVSKLVIPLFHVHGREKEGESLMKEILRAGCMCALTATPVVLHSAVHDSVLT